MKFILIHTALIISAVSAFSTGPTNSILTTNFNLQQSDAALFSAPVGTETETVTRVDTKSEEKDIISVDVVEQQGSLDQFFATGTSNLDTAETASPTAPAWVEPLAWRGVIMVLCALWASNFAAAKLVMNEPGVDSTLYAVTRFSVAALALLPGAIAKRDTLDWETVKASAICGSWVAFGYLGQTFGLMTTTASRSCVICSLHCVFVAALAEYWRVTKSVKDTKYDIKTLFPAAVAVAGVAIVELQGAAGDPTIGDLLSFAQPVGFGMGYLALEDIMAKKPEAALPVSCIKLCIVTLASLSMFEVLPLLNNAGADFALHLPNIMPIISSPVALGGILYTGLVTTALALWVESIAFQRVPATDASIILTTEPLIAALVGAVTLGETFGASDYVGATMIIGACVLAVLIDNPGKDEELCDVIDIPTNPDSAKAEEVCMEVEEVRERKFPFWGF